MTTAIIPVYNEQATLKEVLRVITSSPWVDEVVVVDDASSDGSISEVDAFDIKLVRLPRNKGKSNAVSEGLKQAAGEVILLLDADLIGLNQDHIESLIRPVLENRTEISVGQFVSGSFWTTVSQHITPFLSGQRAVKRNILQDLPKLTELGYGLEIVLTRHCRKNQIPILSVPLSGLSHVVKEKKRGFIKGFLQRLKMYLQILRALLLPSTPVSFSRLSSKSKPPAK